MSESEFSRFYKGKNNVKHLVINGEDVWMTRPKSFVKEMKDLGATMATPQHKKNVLWIFDDNLKIIKGYFMFGDLRDKKKGWFLFDKQLETLDTFEMFHPESKSWIPCVQIHKEEQAIPTNDINNKETTVKKPKLSSTNKTNKVKEETVPWYLKPPLLFLFVVLYIIMCISMCNDEINKGDSFGIETTIRSHGAHGD